MKKNKKQLAIITAGIILVTITLVITVTHALKSSAKSGENNTKLQSDTPETEEILNFLIVGHDKASNLTDVMMLASFNVTEKTVNILQIPRDTYASYTEDGYRKINGACSALGGMKELCSFLSATMAVPIDYYVSLELDAFSEIVDAIGGVEINIPYALDYEDPAQGLSIHLPAGTQTLDGKSAEQFIRFRSGYLCGDLGRIDAQKLFMTALVKKFQSSFSAGTVASLVFAVIDDISTDIPVNKIIKLARAALKVDMSDIKFITLPGSDARALRSGAWYYVLSRESSSEIIKRYLAGDTGTEFDPECVFLNPDYSEFEKIYYGDYGYEIYSADDISENGISIKTTD